MASRRLRAGLALGLLLPQLTGCFHYVPVAQPPVPQGAEVMLDLTDHGRTALSQSPLSGVRRLGGRVVESTDTSLVLAVATVEYADLGVPVQWAGERVEVPREYVTNVRERQLSRSRTALAAGLVAAVALAVSAITLNGIGGSDGGDNRPPGGGVDQ